MTSHYETSKTTLTPETFNDGPLLAELLRVYNKKRAFCGQSRLDYGTPTTEIFKNATNYANGPVDADINTDAGARDASATHMMLFGLSIAIPQTVATPYMSGSDRYIWVNEGTDDPLELPESWAGGLTITALRETHNWHSALTGMIDAINAMQEMRLLAKPTVKCTNRVITKRYAIYSLEEGPERFVIQRNKGPLSTTTRMRPVYSTVSTEDREESLAGSAGGIIGGPIVYYRGETSPNRWSFEVDGFSSSEYCILRGMRPEAEETAWKIADHGIVTEDLLGVAKMDFSCNINVPASGNYDIVITFYFWNNSSPDAKPFVFVFDGESHSFNTTSSGYVAHTFTRSITAPSESFACSLSLDISVADFWETVPRETFDSDMRVLIDTRGDEYQEGYIDTGDARGVGAGFYNYFTLPFSVGFVPRDVGIPDNGDWKGSARDSAGVPFKVDPSKYTLHYTRKIYAGPGISNHTLFIGVSAT